MKGIKSIYFGHTNRFKLCICSHSASKKVSREESIVAKLAKQKKENYLADVSLFYTKELKSIKSKINKIIDVDV